MSGIPGSLLLLLQDLPSQPPGSKVRFLGCVRDYNLSTATLTLTHPPRATPCAEVNIIVPLPTLNTGSLKDGNWVNVIGYISRTDSLKTAWVDAITIWSAEGLQPSKYARVLQDWLETDKEMDAAVGEMEEAVKERDAAARERD